MSRKRYVPNPDFQEDTRKPIDELSLTDSPELWLIQWPTNQLEVSDFHGKELSLKLHDDGQLGCLESSGKSYDVVSFKSQEPNATVFLPSSSSSKVVGKISRRVSFVHFPQPEELEKLNANSLSILKSGGSSRKTQFTGAQSKRWSSRGSVFTQGNLESRLFSKNNEARSDKKRKHASDGSKSANISDKSASHHSATGAAGQASGIKPSNVETPSSEKPKKKRAKTEV